MRPPNRSLLSCAILTTFGACLGSAPAGAEPAPGAALPSVIRVLKSIDVAPQGDRVRVVLKLDAPPTYRAGYLSQPQRFYFDLLNTRISSEVRWREVQV